MGLRPLDVLLGVAVALTWGLGIVFAKAAIEHFPPILLMSLRFAVTAAVLVWFVPRPRGLMVRLCGIAFICAAVQYSLTFTGLAGLDASVVALVVQLEVPFLVLLGAVFLGEQPGWRKWSGIAFAFLGVALISGEPRLGGAWVSLMLVVSGAFAWAVGQVMIRKVQTVGGLAMTAWIAMFAAPQLLVMSLIFESGHRAALVSAGPVVWAAVLYLGLGLTALGYGIWYTLVRRYPVGMIAPFLLLLPVFSVLGAVLFLGETLTPATLAGGAVVIAGVAFILLAPRERAAAEPPAVAEAKEEAG